MICLNILVRRQWIERERLAYPIVQLPLEMTRPDGRLFRSKMMWLGFAIAGGINLINGFHFFFPALPELPVRHAEIGQYFTQKPYNAIGWTPVYIRSFAIGLAFLTPSGDVFFVMVFLLVLERGTGIGKRAWADSYCLTFPMIGHRSWADIWRSRASRFMVEGATSFRSVRTSFHFSNDTVEMERKRKLALAARTGLARLKNRSRIGGHLLD